jgi:sec-independent protein translocase protein TatB
MFDIGWTEMLVIAVVMIVVVGPKDLPKMLRTFGKMTTKMRSMAGDFQKQFNDALKEAELDDVKKSVDALRSMNPANEIKKQLNPFEKAAADVRAGLQSAMAPKPSTSVEPAVPTAHEAEPLKNGATEMPGVAGPEAMPVPPSIVAAAATPVAAATPAPSPEPAKPSAAIPMADPQPAKANGAETPVVAKPVATRATRTKAAAPKPAVAAPVAKTTEPKAKAPARTKSAAAAAPAAAKAAKPKPAASARKPAEKSK